MELLSCHVRLRQIVNVQNQVAPPEQFDAAHYVVSCAYNNYINYVS